MNSVWLGKRSNHRWLPVSGIHNCYMSEPFNDMRGNSIQVPDFRRGQVFNFEQTHVGVKICNHVWIWGIEWWYSWYYKFESHLHKDSILSHSNEGDYLRRDNKNLKKESWGLSSGKISQLVGEYKRKIVLRKTLKKYVEKCWRKTNHVFLWQLGGKYFIP